MSDEGFFKDIAKRDPALAERLLMNRARVLSQGGFSPGEQDRLYAEFSDWLGFDDTTLLISPSILRQTAAEESYSAKYVAERRRVSGIVRGVAWALVLLALFYFCGWASESVLGGQDAFDRANVEKSAGENWDYKGDDKP